MKKALSLALALALTDSLVDCGSGSGSGSVSKSGSGSSAGAEKVSVKLCNTQAEGDLQSQSMIAVQALHLAPWLFLKLLLPTMRPRPKRTIGCILMLPLWQVPAIKICFTWRQKTIRL